MKTFNGWEDRSQKMQILGTERRWGSGVQASCPFPTEWAGHASQAASPCSNADMNCRSITGEGGSLPYVGDPKGQVRVVLLLSSCRMLGELPILPSLDFLIYKMGLIMPALEGYCKDWED